MTGANPFFPEFATRYIATEAGRIFVQIGGSGPPLVLLHGFPETGVMWHGIAPRLAERFTVVVPDLRGYGWSSAPPSQNGEGYTKRVIGADIVAFMEELGHVRFALAGHDRGARVAYRLTLDHPGRVTRLSMLDVVPTMEVWRAMEKDPDMSPHWRFLAEPEPKPERTIGGDPDAYYLGLMRLWSKAKNLDAFDPRPLAEYRSGWGDPTRVHATCEDYRAGAGQDRADDKADEAAGRTIACPVQILSSTDYVTKPGRETPLVAWHRTFAPQAVGTTIDSGHFIAEENTAAALAAMESFLSGH